MLIQTLVEELQQQYPKIGQQQIVIDADNFLNDFLGKTELLRSSADVTSISTFINLPSEVERVKRFQLYKSNSPIEVSGLRWKIEDGKIKFFDTEGVDKDISTSVDKITLWYTSKPLDTLKGMQMDKDLDITGLPTELHTAIQDGLRERYSAISGDWNAVKYWQMKNLEWSQKAKRLGNSDRDGTEIQIKQH